MPTFRPLPAPDAADLHRQLVGAGLLLLSVLYATSVAAFFAGPALGSRLEWLIRLLAVGTVAVVGPVALWKLGRPEGDDPPMYRAMEGFTAAAFARARVASWVVTLFLLVSLTFADEALVGVPPGVVLEAVLAAMLFSASVAFFYELGTSEKEVDGDA